jgi:hypothetical protein
MSLFSGTIFVKLMDGPQKGTNKELATSKFTDMMNLVGAIFSDGDTS